MLNWYCGQLEKKPPVTERGSRSTLTALSRYRYSERRLATIPEPEVRSAADLVMQVSGSLVEIDILGMSESP